MVEVVFVARHVNAARFGGHFTTEAMQDGLRVFAASFNTGNQRFDGEDSDYIELVDKLTSGHEAPGSEADLVLLGMQEFSDNGYGFGTFARTKTLWRGLSQSKQSSLHDLSREIAELATPPEEVEATRRALADELHAFHQGAGDALKDFQRKYGAEGHDFHKSLADASPVHALSNNATAEQQKINAEVKRRLQQYKRASQDNPKTQFANMTADAGQLAAWGDKFPTASVIRGKLAPVHDWAEKALSAIQDVREKKFPNLLHHEQGQQLWSSFRAKFDTSRKLERKFLSASEAMPGKFKKVVETLHRSIQAEVNNVEKDVSHNLLGDWERISSDFDTLRDDLDRLMADGNLESKFAMGVAKGATNPGHDARWLLEEWEKQMHDTVDKILDPVPLDLGQSAVEVQMEPQKYDSGWRCAAGNHFDTVLYAYVNPWSTWKIEPEAYESEKCVKHSSSTQTNMGCNIDNNEGVECGKVVNLLVFRAQKGGSSLRICGLNTHMSFAGTAEQRMTLITEAMEETKAANCDTVIFVGDFNSRLHCEGPEDWSSLPAYEMADHQSSSFNYVLSKFCHEEECSLSNSMHANLDELTQMLNLDELSCFEEESGSSSWLFDRKKEWKKINTPNTVKSTGLQEVELPKFAPTYKLVAKKKADEADLGWSKCLKGEPSCFMNPSKKGKHNPAWTDRILVKAKPTAATVETMEYSRRPISVGFGSDHAPVVAKIVVSPA